MRTHAKAKKSANRKYNFVSFICERDRYIYTAISDYSLNNRAMPKYKKDHITMSMGMFSPLFCSRLLFAKHIAQNP